MGSAEAFARRELPGCGLSGRTRGDGCDSRSVSCQRRSEAAARWATAAGANQALERLPNAAQRCASADRPEGEC